MEIKNRLYPYPVLCEDTDDYIDGDFFVDAKLVRQGLNDILVQFDIHLENLGLQNLINKGKAEFVIHLECSNTAFRTVVRTFSNKEQYRIMNSRVNGDINLLGMVVSKEKIVDYKNPSLNEDYDDIIITIDKASILAYDNMDSIHIAKNYEELSEKDSIFSVVKQIRLDQNEHNAITFALDTDKIKIRIDDDLYSSYITYKGNSSMQPLMSAILVMPALTFMIETLRNEDIGDYTSSRWFIKMEKYYAIHGKNFVEDIIRGEDMISDIVQEMLQLPIGKTLLSIPDMLGE